MQRFIGAWRLVAFEEDASDGKVVHPYGKDAAGLLIYDSSGYMSVQIMRLGRDSLFSRLEDYDEQIKDVTAGFTSFFGTFEIDDTNNIVTHYVRGHIFPDSVGKILRREFRFSGDRLTLKPSPNRRVTWERISAAPIASS